MISLDDFKKAGQIVKEVTKPTNLIYCEYLSKQTGAEIYLKPENKQVTGAYKVRGAYYKISKLTDEERKHGIITASTGNHAQGVAYAAARHGCTATIVMPEETPIIKINRTSNLGANVVIKGKDFDESCKYALELAEEKKLTFVHPFNDLDVMTGQGTIALEIFEELPDADYIIVPVGGGGLIGGISACTNMLNDKIKVIGVEPKYAPSMTRALENNGPIDIGEIHTIADGTAVREVGDVVFPYTKKYVKEIFQIPDTELMGCLNDMIENEKMIVENSGLLSVASLKHLDTKGKKIVCVLSGGNIDVTMLSLIIKRGLVERDRLFFVSMPQPNSFSEINDIFNMIEKQGGNVVKLESNELVNTDTDKLLEMQFTIEAFGSKHKEKILNEIKKNGYSPKEILAKVYY